MISTNSRALVQVKVVSCVYTTIPWNRNEPGSAFDQMSAFILIAYSEVAREWAEYDYSHSNIRVPSSVST